MRTSITWMAWCIGFLFTVPYALGQPHFAFTVNTGVNATIAIPDTSGPVISGLAVTPGDEVGAFTSDGLCVGSVVWSGRHVAITAWGDDLQTPARDGMTTGDTIRYRVWLQTTRIELPISRVTYASGDGVFREDGILVISSMAGEMGPDAVFEFPPSEVRRLAEAFPNPFNARTFIRYSVAEAGPVSIRVHNLLGVIVATLEDRTLLPGEYSIVWAAGEQPSGLYFCRMTTTKRTEVIRLLLIR